MSGALARASVLLALTACSAGGGRPAPPPHEPPRAEPSAGPRALGAARARAEELAEDGPIEQPRAVRYPLGELPTALEPLRWPEPPRIARVVAIDDAGASAVVDREGTRVVVRSRIEHLQIRASDVEVRVRDGARVGQLSIERGLSRILLAGGSYGAIELPVPAQHVPAPPVWRPEWLVTDVTIDGVEVEAADTAFAVRGRRVAIVNSRASAGRYSIWCGDTHDFQTEDLVVAGNRFDSAGPEATVRLVGVRRAVVVDNELENTLKHDFRVHGTSDAVLFARNRLVNTGLMIGSMPGDRIGAVWVLDNELHHVVPSLFEIGRDRVRRLTVRGNRVYSDRWRCFVCGGARAGWDVGDNPVAPYRPFTRP